MIVQFIAIAFTMPNTCSSDHEIMQLPDTVGILWVYQTSQRNWVIIKVHYRYLQKCLLSWHGSRLGFVIPTIGKVSLGPLGNTASQKPCKHRDYRVSCKMKYYGTSKET